MKRLSKGFGLIFEELFTGFEEFGNDGFDVFETLMIGTSGFYIGDVP